RIVHMLSEQPQPTIRSAAPISSAASGVAKPPLTSRSQGFPRNRPLAAAEVASSAPQASASRSRFAPAPPTPAPPPPPTPGAPPADDHRQLRVGQRAGQLGPRLPCGLGGRHRR